MRLARPLFILVALALAWLIIELRSLPPDDPTVPERVEQIFIRCSDGGAYACVVDGDTFRLGKRKIRIRGIDAPEVGDNARCRAEAELGERATERLIDLLNAGPVTMTGKSGNAVDQYGRDLRDITAQDGSDIGETLIGEGLVRPYRGRKAKWC